MRFSLLSAAASCLAVVSAQSDTGASYTDTDTGITFAQTTVTGADPSVSITYGFTIAPYGSGYDNEFIGRIRAIGTGAGWAALAPAPDMPNILLITAWPNGKSAVGSLRYSTAYVYPDLYTGNATLVPIKTVSDGTGFDYIYRCIGCWSWGGDGAFTGPPIPPGPGAPLIMAGASLKGVAPTNPADPGSVFAQHDATYGSSVNYDDMVQANYAKWAAAAGSKPPSSTPTGGSSPSSTPSATAAPSPTALACTSSNAPPSDAYDYIIVGAGAGGIPVAAKLSESGKKVLLIERGPPSSGRWGGTMKPDWLSGTNLTRFDVPGLCNEIWVDSTGIACPDTGSLAGCVLGGGTAINAALWWRANPADFDYNFPAGWKSSDMQAAISRVFNTIPGTDHPSMDHKLYLQTAYGVLGSALAAGGYQNVSANQAPGAKNAAFSYANYMYSNGERGGPMATYLVDATKRSNFKLWMNTGVARVTRTGAQITGVQVESWGTGGYCGNVSLTATGRVILSAGTFGSAKILLRSGIGPTDQLNVVAASADSAKMVPSSQWINLPVGYNLDDHVNTDMVVNVTATDYYDWYGGYDSPVPADAQNYLQKRIGPLTQSAPNIGPLFWDEIGGADGITRQLQYTPRVEGSHGYTGNLSMTISQYLGRGATSRGRLTITSSLNTVVSTLPYLNTQEDINAVIAGIKKVKNAFANSKNVVVVYPTANQTVEDFVAAYPKSVAARSANHWIGTAKMGTDSGLVSGGTAVVDTNTKVYGTNNLFVVDASIFPGMMTTNPSALIVAVAEQAAAKILALPLTSGSVGGSSSSAKPTTTSSKATTMSTMTTSVKPTTTSVKPTTTTTTSVKPTTTSVKPTTTTTTTTTTTKAAAPTGATFQHYAQCGGTGFTTAGTCVSGTTCQVLNAYYWQCL